jgi:hypothetical protein
MAGFAVWMMLRKPSPHGAAAPASGAGPVRQPGPGRGAQSADPRQQRAVPQSSMLDALKDELFQLETDRLQGKISQQDYTTAKAGLDMLFRRHMKKAGGGQQT